MTVTCVITHNGTPLPGATVTFVPEKFLGDEMKTGVGITEAHGVAKIKAPGGEMGGRGLSPGFYRIEVTKPGEPIPPKYNTETILGEEAAPDPEGVHGAFQIDLDY
jgi:hypothetical protein